MTHEQNAPTAEGEFVVRLLFQEMQVSSLGSLSLNLNFRLCLASSGVSLPFSCHSKLHRALICSRSEDLLIPPQSCLKSSLHASSCNLVFHQQMAAP